MLESFPQASEQRAHIKSDHQNGDGNHAQIPAQFLYQHRLAELFQQDQVVNIEVYTEEDHRE